MSKQHLIRKVIKSSFGGKIFNFNNNNKLVRTYVGGHNILLNSLKNTVKYFFNVILNEFYIHLTNIDQT